MDSQVVRTGSRVVKMNEISDVRELIAPLLPTDTILEEGRDGIGQKGGW